MDLLYEFPGGLLPAFVSPMLERTNKEKCMFFKLGQGEKQGKGYFFSTRNVDQHDEGCQFHFIHGKTRKMV